MDIHILIIVRVGTVNRTKDDELIRESCLI